MSAAHIHSSFHKPTQHAQRIASKFCHSHIVYILHIFNFPRPRSGRARPRRGRAFEFIFRSHTTPKSEKVCDVGLALFGCVQPKNEPFQLYPISQTHHHSPTNVSSAHKNSATNTTRTSGHNHPRGTGMSVTEVLDARLERCPGRKKLAKG